MNLEQAIHEHWADSSSLEGLLSADRLTTGRTHAGTPPYATLQLRTIRSELPTNQGPALEEIAFRINLWHESYDDAKAIAEQVRTAFAGASLEIGESGQLARIHHAADSIKQHGDGLWQWTVDLVARVYVLS